MRKFLVVGVGGSGGATIRYLMDQLQADLRARDVQQLPAAWQFVQVDVNPVAEQTRGLGSIQDLGGTYVGVSSAGNTFRNVRAAVEDKLARADHLEGLLGWSPEPRGAADNIPVSNGAGQFRLVGRSLTLTRLDDIQAALTRAWQGLQHASPWGDLPAAMPDQAPYSNSAGVIPIVVGSLAGGSGASMFLDVCRVMGRIPGLDRKNLGVFLFTPDVFSSLDPPLRKGIDGNALAALGELIASQTGASDEIDNDLLSALGLAREPSVEKAFGTVFSIGSTIGNDLARFGENAEDIFRGLGRALAATVISEKASEQYLKTRFENPLAQSEGREVFGWGCAAPDISWGSFGYASLSLGRDRYAEYVAQRLARTAVDRLVSGFHNPASELPPTDQLDQLIDNQWGTIMDRLGLPPRGTKAKPWLLSGPLTEQQQRNATTAAVGGILATIDTVTASAAGPWLDLVVERLSGEQTAAARALQKASHEWAEGFAANLEQGIRDEALRLIANPRQGLPFVRRALERLADDVAVLLEFLSKASRPSETPLVLPADLADKLRRADLSNVIIDEARLALLESAKGNFFLGCAQLAAGVLKSYADDVLPALRRSVGHALENLDAATKAVHHQAGLAQLRTTIYNEWPSDSDVVPPRFDHAHNEVLLTTSAAFPATFLSHVEASAANGVASSGVATMVEEIVRGKWDTVGAEQAAYGVIEIEVPWRAPVLATDAASGQPTPPSKPVYRLALATADILDRALAYQARKDYPFASYSTETFAGYLDQVGIADSERDRRRTVLLQKFEETIKQAYPLVGVSSQMVQTLHGVPLRTQLTFSDVPLAPGSAAANGMHDLLAKMADLEPQTLDRFDGALSMKSNASKIAIYGSYPPYFPLVFTSFLRQLQDRWANEQEAGKRELWKWKRTRPLPASVGMGIDEQASMIKGWYLGRGLGLIHQPETAQSGDPIQVFDRVAGRWLAFETRLLTPRDHYRDTNGFDWLPGVLEAHTLALVNSVNDPSFRALAPYQALRRIYDSGVEPSKTGQVSADLLVADWLRTGTWPSGEPSPIRGILAAGPNPEDRAAALGAWLRDVRGHVERTFLVAPTGPGTLARWRTRVPGVPAINVLPMFAEIALDVQRALGDLDALVTRALGSVQSQGSGDGVPQI